MKIKKSTSTVHTHHSHGKADYVGIAGSVLCLIHCLVTPALAVGSTLSFHDPLAGEIINLDYFFILINGIAVYFATRAHRLAALRLFMWSAFVLFSVSLLLESQNSAFIPLGYLGSGLLIVGHFYNLLFCRPWPVSRPAS